MHQSSIFKQKGVEKWLDYMDKFDDYCMGNWENVDTCVKEIEVQLGIKGTYPINGQ